MPSKRQFRRLRRLRLIGSIGVVAVGLGGIAVFSALGDVAIGRRGGWAGVVVGLILVASGLGAVSWAIRARGRIAAAEWQELRAQGSDDGLPLGAFRQDQRVGLEASDKLLIFGVLAAVFGLIFAVAGVTDPQVGWQFGLAFSLVGFVPAALFFWLGTGVKYWLTPDGVARRGRRQPTMHWVDIERIVPKYRGSPAARGEVADVLELQVAKPAIARPGKWDRADPAIRLLLIEISRGDLLRMLQERVRSAHDIE